ncbi:recombinase family protein [uncultured Hoeflea sp.]|uniref:recombinase family protein n=1 Tax=uncultured Hoeflea sp. TaxID=538666 RepID=UPI0030DC2498
MMVGYARVSTLDQSLDLQLNALRKAGCHKIFTDFGVSGKGFARPGLIQALECVCPGSTLVVWRLDRLGRSLPKLISLVEDLGRRQIEFHSLTENIDTTSSGGKLIFHIMAALAEFERSLISERTRAGMEAARLKGKHLGRRKSLTATDVAQARTDISNGRSANAVAEIYGITPRTLRRYLRSDNQDQIQHSTG